MKHYQFKRAILHGLVDEGITRQAFALRYNLCSQSHFAKVINGHINPRPSWLFKKDLPEWFLLVLATWFLDHHWETIAQAKKIKLRNGKFPCPTKS